jgi:hypothetical protein
MAQWSYNLRSARQDWDVFGSCFCVRDVHHAGTPRRPSQSACAMHPHGLGAVVIILPLVHAGPSVCFVQVVISFFFLRNVQCATATRCPNGDECADDEFCYTNFACDPPQIQINNATSSTAASDLPPATNDGLGTSSINSPGTTVSHASTTPASPEFGSGSWYAGSLMTSASSSAASICSLALPITVWLCALLY